MSYERYCLNAMDDAMQALFDLDVVATSYILNDSFVRAISKRSFRIEQLMKKVMITGVVPIHYALYFMYVRIEAYLIKTLFANRMRVSYPEASA